MPTPSQADPDDFGAWKQRVDRLLNELYRRVQTRGVLAVSGGDFVVSGGGRVIVKDAGGIRLENAAGGVMLEMRNAGGSLLKPDGTQQPVFYMWRDDNGSIALSLDDPLPNSDGYRQILRLWDRGSHEIFSEDVNSGFGFAYPHQTHSLYPAQTGGFQNTISATYTSLWNGSIPVQQPYLFVQMWGWCTTAGTTGDLVLFVNGAQVGSVSPAIGNAAVTQVGWQVPFPASINYRDYAYIEVKARRTAGTGNVSIAPLEIQTIGSP